MQYSSFGNHPLVRTPIAQLSRGVPAGRPADTATATPPKLHFPWGRSNLRAPGEPRGAAHCHWPHLKSSRGRAGPCRTAERPCLLRAPERRGLFPPELCLLTVAQPSGKAAAVCGAVGLAFERAGRRAGVAGVGWWVWGGGTRKQCGWPSWRTVLRTRSLAIVPSLLALRWVKSHRRCVKTSVLLQGVRVAGNGWLRAVM